METLEAIRTMRVIRRFSPEPIPAELLGTIVRAGRHAGSSKNLQRWAFIVVHDRSTLERLSKVGAFAGHVAGATVGIALVTPAVGPNDPWSIIWDLGRAAQNMTLAAWSLGIGSVPATVYDQPLARSILGYPEDHWCEYILSLGYPADPSDLTRSPKAGGRRPLDEMLHDERW